MEVLKYFYVAIFPLTLFVATTLRPCLFSLGYGVLLIVWPFLSYSVFLGQIDSANRHLVFSLVFSLVAVLSQVCFHAAVVALPSLAQSLIACQGVEPILRLIGLQKLSGSSSLDGIRLLLPDILVLLVSVICVALVRLSRRQNANADRPVLPVTESAVGRLSPGRNDIARVNNLPIRRNTSLIVPDNFHWRTCTPQLLVGCLFGALAIIYPCISTMVYFVLFLTLMTMWSVYMEPSAGASRLISAFLLCYSALILTVLYLYQLWPLQTYVEVNSLTARLFGLQIYLNASCEHITTLNLVTHLSWNVYVYPIVIFAFYMVLAFHHAATTVAMKRITMPSRQTSTESLISLSPSAKEDRGPFYQKDYEESSVDEQPQVENASPASGKEETSLPKTCYNWTHAFYVKLFPFLLHHFYTVSLVIMMTWAVLYHSWLSFVWLIVACVVWMFKDSRRAFKRCSPFVLIYAQALVAAQFIYSLQLTESELPDKIVGVPMKQIGFIKSVDSPVLPLFVKLLFTISFWVTIRLLFFEKKYRNSASQPVDGTGYGTFSAQRRNVLEALMAKYWIYVVGLVLLLISIRQPVFAYNIVYMAFFMFLVSTMLLSFKIWKKMLLSYWLILAAYSIAVLLLIYTYQFHGVPALWHSWTSWTNETLSDFGLVTYSSGSLFLQLLTPISFLIVVILQLKFFHAGFLRIANPIQGVKRDSTVNHSRFQEVMRVWLLCLNVAWRFCEIHISKLIAFVAMLLAIVEVSAVNALFPVLVAFMLCAKKIDCLICFTMAIWSAAICLAKMLFQLHFADVDSIPLPAFNCSSEFGKNATAPTQAALWAGFSKTDSISAYLHNYILIIVLMAVQVIIYQRQKYNRDTKRIAQLEEGVLFQGVNRKKADDGALQCFMFLVNYGFYKFGLEIFYISIIVDISVRMDAVALIYGLLMLILISMNRRLLANVWFLVVLFISVVIMVQYVVCVGLPPALCISYPWHLDARLVQWLFLPDYLHPPNVNFLFADFFILLTASCQLYVFRLERRGGVVEHAGGDNAPIDRKKQDEEGDDDSEEAPNFFTNCNTGLDVLKVIVFKYFHWVTLMSVFAAGVGGVSAFAFGYLIAAFSFLWKGNELYLKPFRVFLKRWYIILYYNIIAILLKVGLQVVGCAYLKAACNASPSLVQLFSIACAHKGIMHGEANENMSISSNCKVSAHQAQILYDSICFAFLIFQLRIINSSYFKHVIVEIKAEQIFSARGAVLIDQLIRRKMNKQQKHESEMVEKVKVKTKRIRERYLKHLKEGEYFEPKNYADAKRAGDYYMFDDSESEMEDSKDDLVDEEEKPIGSSKEDEAAITPGQLFHFALESDYDLNTIAQAAEEPRLVEHVSLEALIEEQEKNMSDEEVREEKKKKKKRSKVRSCLRFLLAILVASMKKTTAFLNQWSSEHRYVACVLDDEKRRLKASLGKELYAPLDADKLHEIVNRSEIGQRIYRVPSECSLARMQDKVESTWADRSAFRRFLTALYYLLISNTDVVCYLMIIFNQMFNASVISLPLPLFTFLWGTLCTPRPPKVFWVTLITYLESMIVVKFVLQFGFFPWNQLVGNNDPFYPPRILGVEKKADFATLDIALLMVLFFHRHHLKTLGLWRESGDSGVCFDDIDRTRDEKTIPEEQLIQVFDEPAPKDSFELKELSKTDQEDVSTASDQKQPSQICRNGAAFYFSPIITFYRRVICPPFRYIIDLYAWMFLCDFICFLISAFSYTSFGVDTGRGDVVADIQSNKVPLPYVVILIVLMALMVIDRAIYLRKSVVGKLIFQYVLAIGTHVWIFFILPAITGRHATRNVAAMLWYFVKGVYLLVSAIQLRNGYPSKSLSNFLTKHYSFVNYCLFTSYRAVPFLFELRTLIDWIWIETSMPLFDYITMENIFARVYSTKCNREYEKEYPVPRGKAKTFAVKYGMGIPILLLLITLLWLPLLLFSTVNSIGIRLLPQHSGFKISVDGFPVLYSVEAQGPYIKPLNPAEFDQLYKNFTSKHSLSFLREYSPSDTVRAMYRKESDIIWAISAPGKEAMLNEASSSSDMSVTLEFDFTRPSQGSSELTGFHSYRRQVTLPAGSASRNALIGVLKGEESVLPISKAFPWLVVLPALGPVHPAYSLLDAYKGVNMTSSYADLYLHLHVDNSTGLTQWWEVSMEKPQVPVEGSVKKKNIKTNSVSNGLFSSDAMGLQIVAFVDRVFPSALSYFTSRGIIGVYLVVVLAAARLIRTLVVTSPLELIINEIPNVDKMLRLCLDIFLVREAKDFLLEIDLYAKMIFLLRSPETLIRYTRPKVE